jgi:aryl-alcohol dehydrogenase
MQAAKIIGCKTIVGIDIVSSRLKLAEDIGATAVINSSDLGLDLGAQVKKLFNGVGPSVTIDATGNTAVAASALQFTAPLGRLVLVGVPTPAAELPINLSQLMSVR